MSVNEDIQPLFDDPQEKIILDKARSIAQEEIAKSGKLTGDPSIKNKIDKLRERLNFSDNKNSDGNQVSKNNINDHKHHEHNHDIGVSCPGCKKHALNIDNNNAKCTDGNCGKEFLMVEKNKNDRNSFMCTTCGHTIDNKTARKLKDDNKNCPFCDKGSTMMNIDWATIDKRLNTKPGSMFKRK